MIVQLGAAPDPALVALIGFAQVVLNELSTL